MLTICIKRINVQLPIKVINIFVYQKLFYSLESVSNLEYAMTIKYVAQHCDIASGTRDLMPSNNDIHIVNLNCKVIKIDINIKMQNVRCIYS